MCIASEIWYTLVSWEERRIFGNNEDIGYMPRVPHHVLIWSTDRALYELYSHGQLVERFGLQDDQRWFGWLDGQMSFTFQGATGRLNLYREARSGGARYWYAYQASGRRTRKRYLGRTDNLRLARLEQAARDLGGAESYAPEASIPTLPRGLDQPDPSPQAGLSGSQPGLAFLEAKLSQPRLPTALVARERLLLRLDAALEHSLTLLSASAGWGKTTLLATWLASLATRPKEKGKRPKQKEDANLEP